VLGTPPAFILSQDQTLQFIPVSHHTHCPGAVRKLAKTQLLTHYLVFKEQAFVAVEPHLLLSFFTPVKHFFPEVVKKSVCSVNEGRIIGIYWSESSRN
jgi:hypothetical protein